MHPQSQTAASMGTTAGPVHGTTDMVQERNRQRSQHPVHNCWRLYTFSKLSSLTQGQIYHYHSVNGQGLLSYLIMVYGTTWYFLDAATGNLMLTLINVPGGTAATDQDGSLLLYSYNPNNGNIALLELKPIYPSAIANRN